MNYELAKELKDAGFPQHEDKFPSAAMFEQGVYQPTLSELIAECGDDFTRLYRADKDGKRIWVAQCCDATTHNREGVTPEEAVKNLWLALN